MVQLPDPSYRIPQRHLTAAIEGLRELATRLELEAAAFAMVHTREGTLRAAELLEQVEAVRESGDFFLNL